MLKLPILTLILTAVPSGAQIIAAPSQGALAWSGPVARTMSAAGHDRAARLGSLSLPRLTAPGADGRIPSLASPELLNPLVETLVAQKVDLDAFALLPTEARLTILAEAAKATEARLGREAAAIAEKTRNGLSEAGAAELADVARRARATSVYLDEASEAHLAEAEKVVTAFQKARAEALRAFREDLPKKIAAGAFTGSNLLTRDDSGTAPVWRARDEAPSEIYRNAESAFYNRLNLLGDMEPGPWSAAEAELLLAAFEFNRENGTIPVSDWSNSLVRILLPKLKAQGVAASTAGKLGPAAARFSNSGRVRASDVIAVEAFYERAVGSQSEDWRAQARVLATVHTGGSGLPGWERLQTAKHGVAARMNRAAVVSSIGAIAALIAATISGYYGLLSGLIIPSAVMFAILAPVLLCCYAVWRRDALLERADSISLLMRRYFKD